MVDFFELGDSLALSLLSDFDSVFLVVALSDFLVDSSVLVFSVVVLSVVALVEELLDLSAAGLVGFVGLSAAGLLAVAGDLVVEGCVATGVIVGAGFTVPLVDGVIVVETDAVADAAGVMVAPTLALAAGVAVALVDALEFVVVVAPLVLVTPTLRLKLGAVTP